VRQHIQVEETVGTSLVDSDARHTVRERHREKFVSPVAPDRNVRGKASCVRPLAAHRGIIDGTAGAAGNV
jgi:hypothetical protein